MTDRQVVFIMGTGHCGSTLLDLLLGSHSLVFSLGELNQLQGILDNPETEDRLCSICLGECEYWNRRLPPNLLRQYFPKRTYLNRLLKGLYQPDESLYQHLITYFEHDILVDSSKNCDWITAQMKSPQHWETMSPILLYMVRDGRAVVNSYLRKYPEKSIEREVQRWQRHTEEMEAYYEQFTGKKMIVRYEELCTRPAEIMQEVCRLLSIDFEPVMLNYWIHDHHLVGGNAGTRSLITKYRSQFATIEPVEDSRTEGVWHGDYYKQAELAIQLDLRWRDELTPQQLDIFESIAGKTNQRYAYDPA